MKSIASLKSPTVLIVAGALVAGAVGSKMLWPDAAPAIKVPVAPPKPTGPSAARVVTPGGNGLARQNTRALPQNRQNIADTDSANAEAAPSARRPAAQPMTQQRQLAQQQQLQQQDAVAAAPAPAQPVAQAQPFAQPQAEQDEAPVAPKPARLSIAAAKRLQPSEVDNSSDTEGLFLISSLKDGQNAGDASANAAPAVNNTVAIAPANSAALSATAARTTVGEPANNALAEQVVTTSAGPAAAPGSVTDGLGPVFVDDANGYYMRFPAAWSIRKFDGEPWVIECGDGKSALMSVGFSPFPAEYTADNIPLDWVARRVKKRPDTVLNAQGYATIMGRKAIWSKSTGPMQMGGNQVKVVRTTYIIPLGDGRIAEIRIAAAPEQFDKIANVMKNAVSTFRLVPKRTPETQVAHIE